MCPFQSHGMDADPFTDRSVHASSSDDRLQDLLSALHLPALPTGGSRVAADCDRRSNLGQRAGQPPAPLWHLSPDVDSRPAHSPYR